MSGRGSKNTHRARAEQERARAYAARTALHEGQVRRRVRDNTIVGIAGGLLVVASVASQFTHAAVTAPEPTETRSPAPQVTLPPRPNPAPTE